jgi:hypothetical protein
MDNKFIYQGKKSYESSKEFRRKKYEIKKNVSQKYTELLNNEKNIFKKIRLLINKKRELKKELDLINSKYILFSKSKQ